MDAAHLLRTVRAASGMTLRELAAAAGTSHSTLSAYEHGSKNPAVDTLDRIVRAAGFSLDVELHRRHRGDERLSRGDELEAVLRLAEVFPSDPPRRLQAPVFGRR